MAQFVVHFTRPSEELLSCLPDANTDIAILALGFSSLCISTHQVIDTPMLLGALKISDPEPCNPASRLPILFLRSGILFLFQVPLT